LTGLDIVKPGYKAIP